MAAPIAVVASWDHLPMRVRPATPLDNDELFEFCAANSDLRIERNADGEILIMSPAAWKASARTMEVAGQLRAWAMRDATGTTFESSAGFVLPNGAMRAPDCSWVRTKRLRALAPEHQDKFAPLCPDFVIELVSPSNSLARQQEKMVEYIDNGVWLGWLIDPDRREVHVYRPDRAPEILVQPDDVSGDPELAGFVLDLRSIW